MHIFLLLLISPIFAQSIDVRSLREKTVTRDNTFCRLGKERIEFQIRSDSRHTEPHEKKYGEYVFYYNKKRPYLLPLNVDRLNNYRFFPGRETSCSKTLGYQLEKDKVAILFLKENRPFMDKLSLQIFDASTLAAGDVIDSEFSADKTEATTGGFIFRTYAERQNLQMGSIKIQDIEYFFQDRDFSYWMKYGPAGFEISTTESFKHSPWKKFFKDEQDFLTATGWDSSNKKFNNSVLFVAINHQHKKECIVLVPPKTKITGPEQWRCL